MNNLLRFYTYGVPAGAAAGASDGAGLAAADLRAGRQDFWDLTSDPVSKTSLQTRFFLTTGAGAGAAASTVWPVASVANTGADRIMAAATASRETRRIWKHSKLNRGSIVRWPRHENPFCDGWRKVAKTPPVRTGGVMGYFFAGAVSAASFTPMKPGGFGPRWNNSNTVLRPAFRASEMARAAAVGVEVGT